MGVIVKILSSRIEKRSGVSNPSQWFIDWVTGGAETSSGVTVNEDSALKYTSFWSAVRIISGTLAALPFLVYKRNETGKTRVAKHPIYNLLHNRPNEYMDAITFIETRQAHVLTYGNGYAEIQRDGGGKPVALWPLLPDKTFRRITKEGIFYYEVHPTVGEIAYLPDYNVLHIKGLGFDGYTGYNVVHYNKEAIGYGIGVKKYAGNFFSRGATLGGTYEHPSHLSDSAKKHLQESLDKFSGLSGAHRIMILEEGMKYNKIGVEPEHAQSLETQKYTVDDCARIFNIPPHKLASMEHATFCLPADVEVYTEEGNKSISDIKVGEKVWSLDKDNKWVLSPIIRSGCTGVDEILNIRTTNRNLRANAKHKVLIRRKYHTPRAGIGGYQCINWKTEYIPAGDLRVGDVLVASEKLPDINIDTIGRRKITGNFMSFCGLLLGDGNVGDGQVRIARASNANYMDDYRQIIKKEFVSYNGGNGKNGNIGVALKEPHLIEYERTTNFASVLASKELKSLGLSGNARTKRVPSWVFKTSLAMRLAFLKGFLDADGSVDKKGRISFSSCNETMLSQIRHLCIGCGISVTNFRCQEGVTTLPNGKLKAYKQYCFTCSNPGDNKKINSFDARYIQRLNEGKPFDKKGRKYPWYGGRGFDIDGCSLTRIVSIDKETAEKVYDMEVEGTHSFIANGIVVHNSNIESQQIDFVTSTMFYWFRKWEQECNYKLFMPSERETMFCEILVDALLRGNTQERYQAYNTGRNAGFLCVNDIREKENMNTIGEKGDIFLEPLNMKPAGTETPNKTIEPAKTNTNDNDDTNKNAFRNLLAGQWSRIIGRQKSNEITTEKLRSHAMTLLYDASKAYADTIGLSDINIRGILELVIIENINISTKLEDNAEKYAELTMQRIGGNHA